MTTAAATASTCYLCKTKPATRPTLFGPICADCEYKAGIAPAETYVCPKCGEDIEDEDRCYRCGVRSCPKCGPVILYPCDHCGVLACFDHSAENPRQ